MPKPNPLIPANDYNCNEDYIMLEPQQEAEKSDGGIYIPEQARKFLNEGKIIKLGPLCASHFRAGMFVVFDSSSEYRLDIGGQTIFVVKESNVILFREDRQKKLFPAGRSDNPRDRDDGGC